MKWNVGSLVCSLAIVSVLAGAAEAQFDWATGFGFPGIYGAEIWSFVVFDDGTGPALYGGGRFGGVGVGLPTTSVVRWDGNTWTPLGRGFADGDCCAGLVLALAVFDDGMGPALYAAGVFTTASGVPANNIARWNGTQWSPLGSGLTQSSGSIRVYGLAVFDDGSGPALYAAGLFTTAGGVPANNIARWNGTSWAPVGSGIEGIPAIVNSLAVFDDGSGPALYAGGWFSTAGGVPANYIAKWNGATWAIPGTGMDAPVETLTVFDDGSGPALYAGGSFTTAGGGPVNRIAKWDGSAWAPLGTGIGGGFVKTLAVFDDGSGPALYVGGRFTMAGELPANNIATWDGSRWSALGSGTEGSISDGYDGSVLALGSIDDGTGPALYATGRFTSPGYALAKWDGARWSAPGNGMNQLVYAMTTFDDGSGPALYAGGGFITAGGVAAKYIARWNGSTWAPLGSGVGLPGEPVWVRTLAVFDDGTGPALYAGGHFTTVAGIATNHIAKWDGTAWAPLGSGIGGGDFAVVTALTVFDDGSGPALYASGGFTSAGGVTANGVARWNGISWAPVGSGVVGDIWVGALTVFDDGTGPGLYAGGTFTAAGGVAASNIAKWNGTTWAAVGSGLNRSVLALSVFDDGSGPALYAGGTFTTAGGVAANYIAKWNGSTWAPLGSGVSGDEIPQVSAFAVFDDGSGPALYAGGWFTTAGGVVANRVARWNGTAWAALGSGVNSAVSALTVFDDGTGQALYAGGYFTTAGGKDSAYIAKWGALGP